MARKGKEGEIPLFGGKIRRFFLDLVGHEKESLFDVGGIFGRGLDERDLERVSQALARFGGDGSFVDKIALVADQEFLYSATSKGIDFLQPLLDVVEGLLVGDVVHDDDAVGASVVAAGDGAETLLASSVPNLELDLDSADGNGPDLEVDTDRRDEGVGEDVVRETEQKAALSDATISDDQQLEKEVVLLLCTTIGFGELGIASTRSSLLAIVTAHS